MLNVYNEYSQENVQKTIDGILELDKYNWKESLDYLYNVCCFTGYLNKELKNIKFDSFYSEEYGIIFEININCNRPEFLINNNNNNNSNTTEPVSYSTSSSSSQIDSNYCNLCIYNLNIKKELRIHEFKLKSGKQLFKQFSPFPYYNYHSVIIDKNHTRQVLSEETIKEILELAELMPGYTINSNSDKEYCGVSNIHHSHYQAGYSCFSIYNAKSKLTFNCFLGDVQIDILHYPAGCIKVSSSNLKNLEIVVIKLFNGWRNGNYESLKKEFQSFSLTCKFNLNTNKFEFILIPRNGEPFRFNTRKSIQCIKKEMVGIGEMSGNATLPGRLDSQFKRLIEYISNNKINFKDINLENDLIEFSNWLNEYYFTIYNTIKDKSEKPSIKEIFKNAVANSYVDIISDNSPIKNNLDIIIEWIKQSNINNIK